MKPFLLHCQVDGQHIKSNVGQHIFTGSLIIGISAHLSSFVVTCPVDDNSLGFLLYFISLYRDSIAMLFMLAWLLWLHKYDVNKKNRREDGDEHDEIFEASNRRRQASEINLEESLRDRLDAAVSDHGNECLFISDEHHHQRLYNSLPEEKNVVVDEDIIRSADLEDVQCEIDFDFGDDIVPFSETISQNGENEMRKATLASQHSFKKSRGKDLDVSMENTQDVDTQCTVKHAKILTQESFKKDRGDVITFRKDDQDFSPINIHCDEETSDSPHQDPTLNKISWTEVSSLHMKIDTNNERNTHGISYIENEVKVAPVTLLLNSSEMIPATPEDDEVEAAFRSENSITLSQQKKEEEEEEDMHYITPHGTRVNIKAEPAGRIHSIVVKSERTPTKVHTTSPRVRAVSPRVRVSSASSPIHIHQNVSDDAPLNSEMVHLVVDTQHKPAHKLHVQTDSTENVYTTAHKSPVKTPPAIASKSKTKPQPKQIVEEVSVISNENMVASGNPDFKFDDQTHQNQETIDPNKLKQERKTTKKPRVIEQSVAQTTDFDAIMKKRKKYVDTMDDAATLLGQIAHREDKIRGGKSKILSKHWLKVKEAVRTKKYLSFKDKPMKK